MIEWKKFLEELAMSHRVYQVSERPPLREWIPLSFQHVFAMFGATILVPILVGLNPSIALFTSGIGTLLYIVVTKAKVPVYLGSSFAFITPIVAIASTYGIPYMLGACFAVGIFYIIISFIISRLGTKWLDRLLPPVVIGSVIIVIGLNLAPTAMNWVMYGNTAGSTNVYSLANVTIAFVTFGIAVISSVVLKGFFTVIPILIAMIGGYLFTLIMGFFFPSFSIINFPDFGEIAFFHLPQLVMPKFGIVPIITFLLVALATIAEHLGDTLVASRIVGKDFYKDPGLHRTIMGDGVATSVAALFGGPPNTTYGENVGVMAITHVYSVWVIGGAAVIAIVLSFFGWFGAIIGTIPKAVLGGICMLLFGIIASAGLRTVVERGVDYGCKRNLIISSSILVIGIGGGVIQFQISDNLIFSLGGLALAMIVGIILNLILPQSLNSKE